jgi:hypothetical protein
MTARIFARYGVLTVFAMLCFHHVLDAAVIVKDKFSCVTNGSIISSPQYFIFTNFPYRGMSRSNNPSKIWEITTGTGRVDNAWMHFGRPNQNTNPEYVRCVTRHAGLGDVEMSWKYRSAPFGVDGHAVEAWHATDVWIRYQTQYDLYIVQFDRVNDRVVAKRKVPALGWSGPPGAV